MAIFNSYVSLPEGRKIIHNWSVTDTQLDPS